MDKENVVYICHGVLFSHKKERNMPIATTWVNLEDIMLEDIMLSEINQGTLKDKYCMISVICGIYKSETYKSEYRPVVPGAGVWKKWGDAGQRVQTFS